jgi:hypothetical protein
MKNKVLRWLSTKLFIIQLENSLVHAMRRSYSKLIFQKLQLFCFCFLVCKVFSNDYNFWSKKKFEKTNFYFREVTICNILLPIHFIRFLFFRLIIDDNGRTDGQTDGQTDRQTEKIVVVSHSGPQTWNFFFLLLGNNNNILKSKQY